MTLAAVIATACKKEHDTPDPVLEVSTPAQIEVEGGQVSVSYKVTNPVKNTLPTVESTQTWAHDFTATEDVITFTADPNDAEPGAELKFEVSSNYKDLISPGYSVDGNKFRFNVEQYKSTSMWSKTRTASLVVKYETFSKYITLTQNSIE